MTRLYRLREDYIVIRYSWEASSLPSEEIPNLQFLEGFALPQGGRSLPIVRLWDAASQQREGGYVI